MRVPDSLSFRQKPSGAFKWVLRAPVVLFRWKLGFVFGERLLLISHRGRRSGRVLQTPVEVVEHDTVTHEFIVCSGTGPRADWYLNLRSAAAVSVQVRNHVWVPGQRFLEPEEAAARFAGYEATHPSTARRLLSSMGNSYDGTDQGRVEMMSKMPMVAFAEPGSTVW